MTFNLLTNAMVLAVGAAASVVHGHGLPLQADVSGGRIAVGDGLTLLDGFSIAAFDRSGEGALDAGLFTDLPGFQFSPALVSAGVSLEVLGRPDFSTLGRPQRWLWHWSTATGSVANATSHAQLRIIENFGAEMISLTQFATPADQTIAVTASPGQHHLLLYQLLDSAPDDGAYGFFARLKSPGYEPSAPFLMVFLLNKAAEEFAVPASEINRAAGIAGDYRLDGVVDGADALLWQRTLGAAGAVGEYPAADGSLSEVVDAVDLAVWRSDWGRVVAWPGGTASFVPEPARGWLGLVGGWLAMICYRRGKRNHSGRLVATNRPLVDHPMQAI